LRTCTGATLFPYTTLFRSSNQVCVPQEKPAGPDRVDILDVGSSLPDVLGVVIFKIAAHAIPLRHARRVRPRRKARQEIRSRAERSEEHTSELQSPYDLVCR